MTNKANYQAIVTPAANEAETTGSAAVSFSKQFNGYDKEQVDRYIDNLSKAYQTAYEEYTTVCSMYNGLLEDYNALNGQRGQNSIAAAAITKTLVNSEMLAQQIITDAQAEADRIKAEAQAEADKIKAKTQAEAKKVMEDAYIEKATANIQAQRLTDEAASKAAEANARAQKLVGDAQAEADDLSFRARRNLELTNESVQQTIIKLQELINPKATDFLNTKKEETPSLIHFNVANVS